MLADRRDRAPWTRHTALRSHEADGVDGSAHGTSSLCGGATAPGECSRGQLQPGGIPKSHALRRATEGFAHDPGTGARRNPALRASASEYVYQWSRFADGDAAIENTS